MPRTDSCGNRCENSPPRYPAGDRTAEGDGAQLGDAQRHQAVRQRRVDQVLVGCQPADRGGPVRRIDFEDAVERRQVEVMVRRRSCPEQIRRGLAQANLALGAGQLGRRIGGGCEVRP